MSTVAATAPSATWPSRPAWRRSTIINLLPLDPIADLDDRPFVRPYSDTRGADHDALDPPRIFDWEA
jgi:hypothetical protein